MVTIALKINVFKPEAWMITGALDKSIDHLIGREVRQRQENRDKIPGAVLGISCRGCLAETKDLLKVKYCIFLLVNKITKHHRNIGL